MNIISTFDRWSKFPIFKILSKVNTDSNIKIGQIWRLDEKPPENPFIERKYIDVEILAIRGGWVKYSLNRPARPIKDFVKQYSLLKDVD